MAIGEIMVVVRFMVEASRFLGVCERNKSIFSSADHQNRDPDWIPHVAHSRKNSHKCGEFFRENFLFPWIAICLQATQNALDTYTLRPYGGNKDAHFRGIWVFPKKLLDGVSAVRVPDYDIGFQLLDISFQNFDIILTPVNIRGEKFVRAEITAKGIKNRTFSP